MDHTAGLNEGQRAAVLHEGSNLLIVAGPGTGKTRTLVARIAHRVSRLEPGEKALAITFTNKAAGELAERLAAVSAELPGRVFAGTFHAFSLMLLRRYIDRLPFPLGFSIATPDEIESLANEHWPALSNKERRARLQKISDWKSSLALDTDDPDILSFRAFLRDRQRVDFDDVLRDAVFLLRDHPDVALAVRAEFRDVFVDEYQDMNPIQEKLLTLISSDGVSVTVIGDPDQAIYGFRGSDIRVFNRFASDFPPCRVVTLSENYRSAANILEASHQVISRGVRSDHATPRLLAKADVTGLIREEGFSSDKAEAGHIAREIEKLVGGSGFDAHAAGRTHGDEIFSFKDIAVLYRLNTQGDVISQALAEAGVPFQQSSVKAEPGGSEDVYTARAEKVSLMTMHASKGLEFPVVFIAGCEANLLPLEMEFLSSNPEEERRLFYVGMTRAKQRLYLLYAKQRMLFGQTRPAVPSLFLSDIEEHLKTREVRIKTMAQRKREDARRQHKLF